MARVKFGSLVTEISGSIGGSTFQRNSYGNTLRNKPSPIRSRTTAQLSIRQYMKMAHAGWLDLTAAERQQWNQFVSFSNQKIRHDKNVLMSGHNLYIKYQVMRLVTGLSILDTLQYISIPEWKYPSQIIEEAPNLYLSTLPFSEGAIGNLLIIFKVSTPRPASQQFNPRGLRYCKLVGATWDAFHFDAAYVAVFGALPPIGSYLHYSYIVASSVTPIFSNLRTGVLQVEAL